VHLRSDLKKIICKVRNSPFFSIMIDESTNINAIGHLMIFATIIKEGLPVIVFLGLLLLQCDKKDTTTIFECVIPLLQYWSLDL